ncbi:MAG: SfiI family type II restriction endonuclease, partial [Gammaproteobacteria bacterium]
LQQYSREARTIFETTVASSEQEVIVLAEDLVQYALEVAESYPIDRRFAGFIDYKRVRWLASPYGIFPQVLLVDAKASTENTRETLQASQLPMDAEFRARDGSIHTMPAGIPPHLALPTTDGDSLVALTTSIFVHFYYERTVNDAGRVRRLKDIFLLSLPHQSLKDRYNPNPDQTFFGQGKHSPARLEVPRIRVYFTRLRQACPWRLQRLHYEEGNEYTEPVWCDLDQSGLPTVQPFAYIGRGTSTI